MTADFTLDAWAARLDVGDDVLNRYRSTLDARELARVDRHRRVIDKRHYVAAHGVLRTILAQYMGLDATTVTFQHGPNGKPYVDNPSGIEFNMSDSGGVLLVALSTVAVGVDIEQRRPIEVVKFARRFFTAAEADALEALPEDRQEEAFFRTWTCKEAYVKGWGYGIQRNVGRFQVRVGHPKSRLIACGFSDDSPTRWSLVDIDAIDGYAATIAVEKAGVQEVKLRWWEHN